MAKKEHIVRYTAEELAEKSRRGETLTDWARAAATTYDEVEAQIAADPDEAGMEYDWENATTVMPQPPVDVHLRIDADVLDWFRATGKGYQARINAVLRSYVTQMRKHAAETASELRGQDAIEFSKHRLRKIHSDPQTWQTVYEDPVTGDRWIMDYPQSELQGGGPPRLRRLA